MFLCRFSQLQNRPLPLLLGCCLDFLLIDEQNRRALVSPAAVFSAPQQILLLTFSRSNARHLCASPSAARCRNRRWSSGLVFGSRREGGGDPPAPGFRSLPREASLRAARLCVFQRTPITCRCVSPLLPLLQSLPDVPSLSQSPSLMGPNANSAPSSFPCFNFGGKGRCRGKGELDLRLHLT